MTAYELDVWLEAYDAPVGRLKSDAFKTLSFEYAPEHIARADAIPLSSAIPVTSET